MSGILYFVSYVLEYRDVLQSESGDMYNDGFRLVPPQLSAYDTVIACYTFSGTFSLTVTYQIQYSSRCTLIV